MAFILLLMVLVGQGIWKANRKLNAIIYRPKLPTVPDSPDLPAVRAMLDYDKANRGVSSDPHK